jgi:hypothetical protein
MCDVNSGCAACVDLDIMGSGWAATAGLAWAAALALKEYLYLILPWWRCSNSLALDASNHRHYTYILCLCKQALICQPSASASRNYISCSACKDI